MSLAVTLLAFYGWYQIGHWVASRKARSHGCYRLGTMILGMLDDPETMDVIIVREDNYPDAIRVQREVIR